MPNETINTLDEISAVIANVIDGYKRDIASLSIENAGLRADVERLKPSGWETLFVILGAAVAAVGVIFLWYCIVNGIVNFLRPNQ